MMRRLLMLWIAVALVFVFSAMSTPSAEAWWDNDYPYRVPLTLDVHPDDYQVRIVLDNTVDLGGNAQLDNFASIRFTENENGPLLEFWVENWNDIADGGTKDNVVVWVLRAVEGGLLDNTIYCYYGNATMIDNKQDGNLVFPEFFDNFSGTAVDATKWELEGTVLPDVADGVVTCLFEGGNVEGIDSFGAWADGYTLRARAKHGLIKYSYFGFYSSAYTYMRAAESHEAYSAAGTAFSLPGGVWYVYEIKREAARQRWYLNDVLDATRTDSDTSTDNIRLYVFSDANARLDMDWIFVREFVETEPTVSVGAEEGQPVFTVTTTSSENINYENVGLIGNLSDLGVGTTIDSFFQFRVNGTTGWDNNDYDNVQLTATQSYGMKIDNNGVGLIPNTLYDYRAYAIDDLTNEANGATLTFTTENQISIIYMSNTEALVDRTQDVAGSGATLETQFQVMVQGYDDVSYIVIDNVDFFVYDANGVLVVDNATPDSFAEIDATTRRFDYLYNPAPGLADGDLGTFDVRVYANTHKQTIDNWDNDQFTVNDLDTMELSQENLAAHSHRIYGEVSLVVGDTADVIAATRVDTNDGTAVAQFADNDFENTYTPTAATNVYFTVEVANLDGYTDNLAYFMPNLTPRITNLTVDNILIDRDHDDLSSTVELSTVVTLWVQDNDGRAEIVDVWIASRDNDNAMFENENVTSLATLVDAYTSSYTITINPDDNLPDNGLGFWDIDVWAWDNYGTYQNTSWGDNTYVDSMEDNTWVNGEYDLTWFADGMASMKVSTPGAGTEDMYYLYDLTHIDNISFESKSVQTTNFYIDNVSKWGGSGEENSTIDVSKIVGIQELRFRCQSGGVASSLNVDKFILHSFGDNVFRVSDLTSTVTFSPASPYYRWSMDASGVVYFMDNDNNAICDNIWYLDPTESQNVAFTIDDNWVVDNYDINNTLPGDSAEVEIIMWWNEILDGSYLENYTTVENYQFQVNIYWEENFQPVDDNHIENYENWVATFYFDDYEDQEVPLTSSSMLVYSEYEPRTMRIWDSDNNYFRTYRTAFENIDAYMVADNTAADLYFYTITLDDPTGVYGPTDGYVIIYTFEGGTPVYINDTYWAGTNTITAYLIFGTQYNLRLGADGISDLDWGVFDADANTSQTIIPSGAVGEAGAIVRPLSTFASWSFWWSDNETLNISYDDSTELTNWVAIYVYGTGGVEEWYDNNASSDFTASWTAGDNDNFYTITLRVDHATLGEVRVSEYSSGLWGSSPLPQPAWSPPSLNALGEPPVPWGHLLIAGMFVIIVMSFGPSSIGVGGILVGAIGMLLEYFALIAVGYDVLVMIIALGFLIQLYESRKGGY